MYDERAGCAKKKSAAYRKIAAPASRMRHRRIGARPVKKHFHSFMLCCLVIYEPLAFTRQKRRTVQEGTICRLSVLLTTRNI